MSQVALYPDFFNDVFGPIMQPESSSHMAAPCRMGFMARSLLGEQPTRIEVVLDTAGSFAGTFGVMSEDMAMVAGALGMEPNDARLFNAFKVAEELGVDYTFTFTTLEESKHPNAMKFILTAPDGRTVTLVGDSTGGGMIVTRFVNGYALESKGDTYVLLVFDPEQQIAAGQLEVIEAQLPELVGAAESAGECGVLYSFKLATEPDLEKVTKTVHGIEVMLMAPILPVVTRPDRHPQLFDTMVHWREVAEEQNTPFWEVAIQYQMAASGWTREQIIDYMRLLERKMYRQTHAVYEPDVVFPAGPYKPDYPGYWREHMDSPQRISDDLTANTLKWAYGAGAGLPGVEVVAGPMGSGGGYIHAALWAVKEARGLSDDDLLRGLFVAAGVGVIAFTRTEPTGECIGCTGETAICGAMAAAGIVEMVGGTPQQAEGAASLLLQALIGMPCDPIPGGVGQPCRSRLLTAISMAHVMADLALAGHHAVLPLHEAIDYADRVGRQLPSELLCTSKGGACLAPSAQQRAIEFQEWLEYQQQQGSDSVPLNLI